MSGTPDRDRPGERHALNWVAVAAAILLAGVYWWLWTTTGQSAYVAVVVGLVAWTVAFFTRFWQPILYVPAAVLTTTVAVVWVVLGSWTALLRQVAILLSVVFLATTSYLLVYEEPTP